MVLHSTLAVLAALSTSCNEHAALAAADERLAAALRAASAAIESSIEKHEIPGAVLVVGGATRSCTARPTATARCSPVSSP